MARFEIQADFDHDGKISQSAAEAKLKLTPPGLILIPNLDADGRKRPGIGKIGDPARLDFADEAWPAGDKELTPFIVHPTAAADGDGRLFIEIAGRICFRPKLYDADRRHIRSEGGARSTHVFAIAVDPARDRMFYIETGHLRGDPLCQLRRTGSSPQARLRSSRFAEFNKLLLLLGADFALLRLVSQRSGVTTIEDSAVLSHAPLIFVDNTAPAERLYVAEIPDRGTVGGNSPTLSGIRDASKQFPRVALAVVPENVNKGDAWLQDQFQTGYCHRPGLPPLRVILHLPRARENVVTTGKGNLGAFVAYHFPESDQALYQRFWERTFGKARDETDAEHEISFVDSFELSSEIDSVWAVYAQARELLLELERAPSIDTTLGEIFQIQTFEGLSEARLRLKRIGKKVAGHVAESSATRVQSTVDTLARVLTQRIERIVTGVDDTERDRGGIKLGRPARPGGPQRLEFKLSGKRHRLFEPEAIDRLAARLLNVHHSINFGGNLEIAPPTADAPFGSIVFGTELRENQPGDVELVRFLIEQKVQPFVHINTNWLAVGHVDEVMCFLPVPAKDGGVGIALASPLVAIKILKTALSLAFSGRRVGRPSGAAANGFDLAIPNRGSEEPRTGIILTRALRGKYWLHQQTEAGSSELAPPEIYRQMALFFGLQLNFQSSNEDRHYDASISVLELLHFAGRSNAAIHEHQIKPIRKRLSEKFPSAVIAELPVYFDYARDLDHDSVKASNFEGVQTGSFLPNLVNMQVIDHHVMVPKPYGPRMILENAITVLREVLPAELRDKLSRSALQSRNLHKDEHWAFAPIPALNPLLLSNNSGWRTDLERLAVVFGDGLLESVAFGDRPRIIMPLADKKAAFERTNGGLFGREGALKKKGWNKIKLPDAVPEPTIDLFQAYADVVLTALGLTVHWVDSWYYHIRFGELHCGTNVIRRPNVKRPWWAHKAPL